MIKFIAVEATTAILECIDAVWFAQTKRIAVFNSRGYPGGISSFALSNGRAVSQLPRQHIAG
jgi:hypothetical protein